MAAGFVAALIAALSIRRYGYATIYLAAIVETYAQFRYPFHGMVREWLLGRVYTGYTKTALQREMLVWSGVALGLVLLVLFLIRGMGTGRRIMTMGSLIVIATFGMELISLHSTDAILYHPIGPFALCSLIYCIGAVVAAGGALIERRRKGLSPEPV